MPRLTPLIILSIALPALGACSVAGDIVTPHRELKAQCSPLNATPVDQTGLRSPALTTDPIISKGALK